MNDIGEATGELVYVLGAAMQELDKKQSIKYLLYKEVSMIEKKKYSFKNISH